MEQNNPYLEKLEKEYEQNLKDYAFKLTQSNFLQKKASKHLIWGIIASVFAIGSLFLANNYICFLCIVWQFFEVYHTQKHTKAFSEYVDKEFKPSSNKFIESANLLAKEYEYLKSQEEGK